MNIFSTNLTASALLSAISANVQSTISAIGPVLELVVGIAFAFVLIKYLIGLFSGVGSASGDHHIRSDFNLYHYSAKEMEAKNIDPWGISEFD